MGSACCVAAKDKTIVNGSSGDVLQWDGPYSPTAWSFYWDNRHVAEEEKSRNWLSKWVVRKDRLDNKSQSTVENLSWQKSSPSEDYTVVQSGPLKAQNLLEVNEASQPTSTMISRWPNRYYPFMSSPKVSFPSTGPPLILCGSSHTSYSGSFDNEPLDFNLRVSPPTIDPQTCGVCNKLLSEKSSWASQKIIPSNELPVVSILICGHVYHEECLEKMTPGVNKYDPTCPVCTFGEKKAFKMSEKKLRSEMDLKAKINRLRARVMDGDLGLVDRPRMSSGSKPFLRKHFSFGSTKLSRKKGFFGARSSKE